MLAGFRVRSKPVTGPKEVRAAGVSTQQQRGNVWLPQDPSNRGWTGPLIAECEQFADGRHDDQVDALSAAFNRLNGTGGRLLV